MKAALAWALGVGDEISFRAYVAPASITTIATDGPRPSLHSFNGCAHLDGVDSGRTAPSQRVQPSLGRPIREEYGCPPGPAALDRYFTPARRKEPEHDQPSPDRALQGSGLRLGGAPLRTAPARGVPHPHGALLRLPGHGGSGRRLRRGLGLALRLRRSSASPGSRPIPPLLVLGVVGITVRTTVAVASGSSFFYFAQPVANSLVMTGVFLISIVIGRPMIEKLALEFWPLTPELLALPSVSRLLRGLTFLWAGVNLAIGATTLTLLRVPPARHLRGRQAAGQPRDHRHGHRHHDRSLPARRTPGGLRRRARRGPPLRGVPAVATAVD